MIKPRRFIEVVPYDPLWPELFRQEAERIYQAIPKGIITIHHIGSTAVPGLSAKPVIDMMPEVTDVGVLDEYDQAMEAIGYAAKGEFGIVGRRFYLKGPIERTHHLHAFGHRSEGLFRHLAVRDYLRNHPGESARYAELKIMLAKQFPYDNEGYCEGKHDFVQRLEKRALEWKRRYENDLVTKEQEEGGLP